MVIEGTLPTMDPELLKGKIHNTNIMYNSKIDLWSIGVVFYYFLTRKYIFGYSSAETVYRQIKKLEPKIKTGEYFYNFSPTVRDLLKQLLRVDPTSRIDWKDFFEHPIFKQPMYKELVIQDWYSGIKIISDLMLMDDFEQNSRKLQEENLKEKEVKSVPINFEMSGIDPSEIKNYKTWRSDVRLDKNNQVDTGQIQETEKRMQLIQNCYFHEINKYVFVWYLKEKSSHYSDSPLFEPVHHLVKKMMWVTLKQKHIRVKQIRAGLFQGGDAIGFKDQEMHEKFLQSRNKIDLLFYFKKLENLYEAYLEDLEKEVNPKGKDSAKGLKLQNILTLKSYQRHYWLKVYGNAKVNETLAGNFVEKKAFLVFMLEMMYTMKLSLNFNFMDPKTSEVFSWTEFSQNIKLMSLSSIQKKIMTFFAIYKINPSKIVNFKH